jgi:hypothetical protein
MYSIFSRGTPGISFENRTDDEENRGVLCCLAKSTILCAVALSGAKALSTKTGLPLRSGSWHSISCSSQLSGEKTIRQSQAAMTSSIVLHFCTLNCSHHWSVVRKPGRSAAA